MDFLVDINQMEQDVTHRPGKLYNFNYAKYKKKKNGLQLIFSNTMLSLQNMPNPARTRLP
jgi:hypothetical protein